MLALVLAAGSPLSNIVLWVMGICVFLLALGISGLLVVWVVVRLVMLLSGAYVGPFELIGMCFRKVDPWTIGRCRNQAVKAGIELSTHQLQTHYLARGNVANVVNAVIAADREGLDLSWEEACGIDLAGGLTPQTVENVAGAAQAGVFLTWLSAAKMVREGIALREVIDSGVDPVTGQPLERL